MNVNVKLVEVMLTKPQGSEFTLILASRRPLQKDSNRQGDPTHSTI